MREWSPFYALFSFESFCSLYSSACVHLLLLIFFVGAYEFHSNEVYAQMHVHGLDPLNRPNNKSCMYVQLAIMFCNVLC